MRRSAATPLPCGSSASPVYFSCWPSARSSLGSTAVPGRSTTEIWTGSAGRSAGTDRPPAGSPSGASAVSVIGPRRCSGSGSSTAKPPSRSTVVSRRAATKGRACVPSWTCSSNVAVTPKPLRSAPFEPVSVPRRVVAIVVLLRDRRRGSGEGEAGRGERLVDVADPKLVPRRGNRGEEAEHDALLDVRHQTLHGLRPDLGDQPHRPWFQPGAADDQSQHPV